MKPMNCARLEAACQAQWDRMESGQPYVPSEHTTQCVRCGKPATVWCGHVHRDEATVTAGWCALNAHPLQAGDIGSPPCEGEWRGEYGRAAHDRA